MWAFQLVYFYFYCCVEGQIPPIHNSMQTVKIIHYHYHYRLEVSCGSSSFVLPSFLGSPMASMKVVVRHMSGHFIFSHALYAASQFSLLMRSFKVSTYSLSSFLGYLILQFKSLLSRNSSRQPKVIFSAWTSCSMFHRHTNHSLLPQSDCYSKSISCIHRFGMEFMRDSVFHLLFYSYSMQIFNKQYRINVYDKDPMLDLIPLYNATVPSYNMFVILVFRRTEYKDR